MKPLLITMGDAAGIGPEIIVQAFARREATGCVVVGDVAVMRRAASLWPELMLPLARIEELAQAASLPSWCLPVFEPAAMPDVLAVPVGSVDARCGKAAAMCIEAAVHAVQRGEAAGVVTAPIHKEALAAAGVPYPGHTEMLQALAASSGREPPPVRMMLANPELRVVLVTIHQSLRSAIDAVTFDAVLQTLLITHHALQVYGIPQPRVAVAGLNPHAGEGGLFGSEEQLIIAPAVAAARARGVSAHGPFAPDTVFMRARRGEFDVVVAMTHDHGLIPVKYLGVEQGVNVTLGLPFVRTSPDHGTAFDIAGRGSADPASLLAAIAMARQLLAPVAT